MRNSWEKRDNDHSFLYHQSHHRSSQHFPLLLSRVWSFSFFSSIQSVIRLFTCRQTWTFDLDMASSLTRAGEQQIAGWVLQITVWLLLRYRYCRHCRGGTPAAESCWLGSNVAKKKKKEKRKSCSCNQFLSQAGDISLCSHWACPARILESRTPCPRMSLCLPAMVSISASRSPCRDRKTWPEFWLGFHIQLDRAQRWYRDRSARCFRRSSKEKDGWWCCPSPLLASHPVNAMQRRDGR